MRFSDQANCTPQHLVEDGTADFQLRGNLAIDHCTPSGRLDENVDNALRLHLRRHLRHFVCFKCCLDMNQRSLGLLYREAEDV